MRLGRMPIIRSFNFRVAAGDTLQLGRDANQDLRSAVRMARNLNAVQLDVLLNRGHFRGSLDTLF